MKRNWFIKLLGIIIISALFLGSISIASAESGNTALEREPFKIVDNLFDQSRNTVDLGLSRLEGIEVVDVFTASDDSDHFVNGVVMAEFKGQLYCQWQSSRSDEDAADTWVAYSVSSDEGRTWSEPMVLAPSISNGYRSSGGWYVSDNAIVGYINQWPDNMSVRGGFTYYTQSTDGKTWTEPAPVLMKDGTVMNGIFEQDPHVLESGRIISAAHFQPGLFICPLYTDDASGVKGWVKADYTNMPQSGTSSNSREMEPSMFINEDGSLVMIFRDQNNTYFKLASISFDQGESWSSAVLTNMPDAKQKQSAGNLPDKTAYLVGSPVNNKLRLPLTITLSSDGKTFDKAYVLRLGSEAPMTVKYPGTAKRQGFHYPKSVVIGDYLYVSYAKNKEAAEYVRIPLDKISLNSATSPSEIPATELPTTEVPATELPTTEVPATELPATEVPATELPATELPTTEVPVTEIPVSNTPAVTEPVNYILGDADDNGKPEAADALAILKHAAKITYLKEQSLTAADTNKDGNVDAKDALLILKYLAKIITEF